MEVRRQTQQGVHHILMSDTYMHISHACILRATSIYQKVLTGTRYLRSTKQNKNAITKKKAKSTTTTT